MNPLSTISRLFAAEQVTAAELVWSDLRAGSSPARSWPPRQDGDVFFDLASLSKPLTASLALVLDEAGELDLEAPLDGLMDFDLPARLRQATLADLLRHRAGLPAWRPLYHFGAKWDDRLTSRLASWSVERARRGTYSDLSYMLFARITESVTGSTLSQSLRRFVLEPLELSDQVIAAEDAGSQHARRLLLPCSLNTSREVELAAALGLQTCDLGPPAQGEVQDGNARWFGRYCGHAGLFATSGGVLRFGEEWARALRGRGSLLSKGMAKRALGGRGTRRLGWWLRTRKGSAGPALSPEAFGHTGFVGGSLWIDPRRDVVVCLLAHRSRASVDLGPVRRSVHQWVVEQVNHGGTLSANPR